MEQSYYSNLKLKQKKFTWRKKPLTGINQNIKA